MALSSYWVSQKRKDLAERAIVSRRERDAARVQKCIEVDSYHKDLALKTSKYKSLEEIQGLKTARANEESSVKEKLKHAEKEKLENRRHRLAHVLAVEHEQYMNELKGMRDNERETDPWNICRLKEQIIDLQRKRKEGEQNMQKRYMHHMFSSSIGSSNKNEDQQLQREVSEAWQQRKEELEKLSLEKQEKERERCKALELEQLKAMHEAREVERIQLEEQEKWDHLVQEKMDDLNATETETKKLKVENQILNQLLETLLSLQHRRESVSDLKSKAFQKMQNLWQPKEKLRRMLVEVLHYLDFDYKLLLSMMDFNNSTEGPACALLNLDCVADVKTKIEMQISLEKDRDVEIQQLYNEEAHKLLEKRLKQWSLESVARDEIMNDLFKTLARQIHSKIELNTEQEKKFILIKDTCLKEIDEADKKAKDCIKVLNEKQQYYLDLAKRMSEELESQHGCSKLSKPSSSCGQSHTSLLS